MTEVTAPVSGIDSHDPTHCPWPLKRLRFVCGLNPVKSSVSHLTETEVSFLPMDAIGEDGTLRLDETRAIAQVLDGYTYFRDDDVVVAKITPCFENGKGALCSGLTNGIGFGTTELHVLRAGNDVLPAFVHYITRSYPFRMLGEASMHGAAGQKRVPERFLKDFVVGVPPLREQRAIAAFLDRETATIDALIAKKERLIELLREKRAALISHAVTRGLDPDAPMKESGVELLGIVPAHWQRRRLGHTVDFLGGSTPDTTNPQFWNGDIPWVSSKDMKRWKIADSEDHVTERAIAETSLSVIGHQVVLIVVRGMILAHTFPVAVTTAPLTINQDLKALRPKQELVAEFLAFFLTGINPFILSLTEESSHGTKRLNTDRLKALDICVPPPSEQQRICEHIHSESAKIDTLVLKVRQHINALRERRTALISAAVTGQIDVRGRSASHVGTSQSNG